MGKLAYYIVDAVISLAVGYTFIFKPQFIFRVIFKREANQTAIVIFRVMGVVSLLSVLMSMNAILGL